jgi:hypothetical protein
MDWKLTPKILPLAGGTEAPSLGLDAGSFLQPRKKVKTANKVESRFLGFMMRASHPSWA